MNNLANTLKYFFTILAELSLLFLGVSTLVALLLMYLPKERARTWMSRKGLLSYLIGAIFGALTPFCVCSTIPVTLGLLEAGVPFGAVMSFLIASPLLNPIILTMLGSLAGLRTALVYFSIVFTAAIAFGIILEKTGASRYVKNVRIKGKGNRSDEITGNFGTKVKLSFIKAWEDFRAILIYLLIGVAIGAIVYEYIPESFVFMYAGPNNPFAVPVAAIIGIPLYIRAETAIPIAVSLMQKGMSVGASMALIIGGAGMAIPEMSMLASIFKKKFVVIFIGVIFATAVAGGYMFDILL